MKRPLSRRSAGSFSSSTIRRVLIFCAALLPLLARAEFSPAETDSVRSISGQFIIVGPAENSPLANSRGVATNADYVRLEPALLAVSVERLKKSLWRELAISSTAWRGQIFVTLHPAQSLDEEVTIISKPSKGGWNYLVRLPDVLPQARYVRAMTAALLLEFANRDSGARPAEIPAWLTDGLSQQLLLAADSPEIILSSPDTMANSLTVARIEKSERGLDPLAEARQVLKNFPPLTFEQLSWPTGAQLSGADGGVYRASAQVFVERLLGLKNGASKIRAMLETLPRYYNWQTAFQNAFQDNFPRALDVEKWWALQIVDFISRDPGPRWTLAASREKLDRILSVPVEMRGSSNALPVHAEISLQTVIRNFDSVRQSAILQTRLRDLDLARLQMAAPLAALTDAYGRAIAKYLGQSQKTATTYVVNKRSPANLPQVNTRDILKKLDELDARRRTIESAAKPFAQPSLAPMKF